MRFCLCCGMCCIVRILCRRSASFINTTLMSLPRVSSNFLKFSAFLVTCRLSNKPSILVRPSTISAMVLLKSRSISSRLTSVSSTTSCSKAQAIEVAPSPTSTATIRATAIGCKIYGLPLLRYIPAWACMATK